MDTDDFDSSVLFLQQVVGCQSSKWKAVNGWWPGILYYCILLTCRWTTLRNILHIFSNGVRPVCAPLCIDVVFLQDVIRVHTGLESNVVVRQVRTANRDAMRTTLRELRRHRISRIFVYLSSGDTTLFLKAVVCIPQL